MIPTFLSLCTTDGIRLDADCYRPVYCDPEQPLPVLLMRQPYGRSIASTVVYAHPAWYAAQGYMVIIQDVRGRGTSEGEFRLFVHEEADGLETIAWAAQLPGSNGKVGMYGFSYQGMTQLYGAKAPELVTLAPAMVGYDLYGDWAYEGGAFLWQLNLSWAIQLAAETARQHGDEATFLRLAQAAQNLPLMGEVPLESSLLRELAPTSFYWDWLDHPDPEDPYWAALKPDLTAVDLPMLHIGGWFDPYLRGTLNLYREQKSKSAQPQQLWLGPWGHLPWGRRVGAVDLGPEAVNPIDRVQLQWFNFWLKGQGPDPHEQKPVHWFEMGGQGWRDGKLWPRIVGNQSGSRKVFTAGGSQEFQLYYCQGDGLGTTVGGQLSETIGQQVLPTITPDLLVQDPWRPVPARGGHSALPSGSFDRTDLDDRGDVATYTSNRLTQDRVIFGQGQIAIQCSSSAPSFDLCAVLSVVRPNGIFNFSQGYQRVTSAVTGSSQTVQLTLQATGQRIQAGERLRLSLSTTCYPAYGVNPGTGENADRAKRFSAQVVTVAIEKAMVILPLAH